MNFFVETTGFLVTNWKINKWATESHRAAKWKCLIHSPHTNTHTVNWTHIHAPHVRHTVEREESSEERQIHTDTHKHCERQTESQRISMLFIDVEARRQVLQKLNYTRTNRLPIIWLIGSFELQFLCCFFKFVALWLLKEKFQFSGAVCGWFNSTLTENYVRMRRAIRSEWARTTAHMQSTTQHSTAQHSQHRAHTHARKKKRVSTRIEILRKRKIKHQHF